MNGGPGAQTGSVVLGGSLLGRMRAPFTNPTVDLRIRQARLGSALYGTACVMTAATLPFTPRWVDHGWMWLLVGMAAVVAAVQLVLPWDRWQDWSLLVSSVVSLAFLGVGVGYLGHALMFYLPLFALTFVFVGMTQEPGRAIVLAPFALGFGATEMMTGGHGFLFIPLLIMVCACTLLGELISYYVRMQRIAGETLDELLMSVAGLTGCRTVAEATDLGSAVVARLLGADMAFILLPLHGDSTQYVYAGGSGVGIERNEFARNQVVLDIAVSPSGTALASTQRRIVFVPDARSSDLLQREWLEENDISSALFLPLLGRPGVVAGVAVAGFHRPRRSIDPITSRGLNLVAEATGRVVDHLRQSERLARDAETDALTGLDNRRVFFRELSTMSVGDAMLFLDLDHFKTVNDTLGHAAGDSELAAFGDVLREQVRDSDIAARYGGEEFAVLIRGAGRAGADLLVDRLREAWERRSATTFSVGAALHEVDMQPSATLAAADRAVYAAKASGRNRMCWADDPEALVSVGRASSLSDLAGLVQRHRRGDDPASAEGLL